MIDEFIAKLILENVFVLYIYKGSLYQSGSQNFFKRIPNPEHIIQPCNHHDGIKL